jgi:hypothetical protein
MTPEENSERNQNKVIMLSQLDKRFNFITSADNALEAKAAGLMGLSVAIGLAFWIERYPEIIYANKIYEAQLGLLLLLVVNVVCLVYIFLTQKYASGVVKKSEMNNRLSLGHSEFLKEIVIDSQQCNEHNAKILERKTRAFKYALVFFVAGVCLLILSTARICL